MSLERVAIILCVAAVVLAIFGCIVQHQTRREHRLDRYRPSHDNRFPHRDEFKAFMRDCK